jgi:hypothetical protein
MSILMDIKSGSRYLIRTHANRVGLWKCLGYLACGHRALYGHVLRVLEIYAGMGANA